MKNLSFLSAELILASWLKIKWNVLSTAWKDLTQYKDIPFKLIACFMANDYCNFLYSVQLLKIKRKKNEAKKEKQGSNQVSFGLRLPELDKKQFLKQLYFIGVNFWKRDDVLF